MAVAVIAATETKLLAKLSYLVWIRHQTFSQGRAPLKRYYFSVESNPAIERKMKRSSISDEYIIGILTEHEARAEAANVCRR